MRLKQLYKNRYPGLIPFDKGQSTIFFGRDKEKKELYYQICLEKMVVLFSKSGLGKSSLLNAGISPLLEKNGYLPVRVRFSSGFDEENTENSENRLLRDFKRALKVPDYDQNIQFNKTAPRLWEYVKAVPFNEFNNDTDVNDPQKAAVESMSESNSSISSNISMPVVTVFIFDQFEEFFHHPVEHQKEFLSQLAEIVHEETPYRILDWITEIDTDKRTLEQVNWCEQPHIKVVFSLRSEYLANMQSLVSFIPTVLRNRYELKSLNPEQAAQAIKTPAEKDLGTGYTPAFTFDKNTLDEIIKELKGKTNEIESSQLQIVCNFIEEIISKKITDDKKDGLLQVDNSIINPVKDFPGILENFYESQLNKIENPDEREIARKLIEDDLVIDGFRDSISKNKLISKYGISEDLIEEIQNTRLIREETTSWGAIYELSHDTLIGPVQNSKNKRLLREEKQKEEEERQVLAEEAKKNMEELMAKRDLLKKEMQLRAEAEKQKLEAEKQKSEVEKQKLVVEQMAKKLRFRGIMVFILTVLTFVGFLLYIINDKEKKQNQLKIREFELDSAKQVLTKQTDQYDSVKSSILSIVESTDSILNINNASEYNYKQKAIDSIIDKVFEKELKKTPPSPKKLTTTEKIKRLKKINQEDIERKKRSGPVLMKH